MVQKDTIISQDLATSQKSEVEKQLLRWLGKEMTKMKYLATIESVETGLLAPRQMANLIE